MHWELFALLTFFITILLPNYIFALSPNTTLLCDDIRQISDPRSFTVEEITSMPEEEIVDCLLHLGKLPMKAEEAKSIWSALKSYYGDASAIPSEKLSTLHWVTVAIEPDEYGNISISSVEIVENFGLHYDLSKEQLAAIAERVREDWGDKIPEEYSSYDLMALKQILCAFNESEIKRIHPDAYKEAAFALSDLKKCPHEVLRGLAKLAVDDKAFGPVHIWDKSTMKEIGVVVQGLPEDMLTMIPSNILQKAQRTEP